MKRALLLLCLAGCQPSAKTDAPAVAEHAEPAVAAKRAAAVQAEALQSAPARVLGAPMKLEGAPTPVAAVLSAPEPYLGKTVKCEGKVARVCQAAGCWLELQAEQGGEGLRVPMAAHAFFVPQDAIGHVAVVEGELKRRELPEAQRKHYEGEGMQATGPLSLEATGVVIR